MVNNFSLAGSDCEVFVRLHETPTLLDYHLRFPLSQGSSQGTILSTDIPTAKSDTPIFVGIQADNAVDSLVDAQVTLSFQRKSGEEDMESDSPPPTLSQQQDGSDPVCSNCGRSIPAHNMNMHETFCLRNNIRCPVEGCGQVILRNQQSKHCHCSHCQRIFSSEELPQHEQAFHSQYPCLMCSQWSGGLLELRQHQREDCPQRLIRCRFCEDIVPSGGDPDDWRDKFHWNLSQHESICGSKTLKCDECGQNVCIKEMELHKQIHSNSTMASISSPTPSVSAPAVSPAQPDKDAEMTEVSEDPVECPICNASLPSLRHLNSHLDTQHYS